MDLLKNNTGWFLLAALAVLAALAASSVVIVDESEQVVLTQFGRPVAVHRDAGLYIKAPAPVQRTVRLDKRALFTETSESELLTADKKNVVVTAYLSWRIADPLAYIRAVRTREFAEARLTALVQSELGSALGDLRFDRIVSADPDHAGLGPLETTVGKACAKVASDDYGIEILDFGVTRLNFPPQNLQSVFARMRAERSRIARGYRAEGDAEAQKIRAEADRERAEIISSAESKATAIRGEGEALAARIYSDAYRGKEDLYGFLRTLESYERILNEKTTLVLPADSPFLELLMSRSPGSNKGGTKAGRR